MSTKRAKRYSLIASILGILISILGCVNLADNFNTKNPTEKSSIRRLSIHINEDQREELFDQMQKFSEKHNLEFHLSFYNHKERFFIEMYGEGLEILALSNLVTTTKLDFDFFEKDPTNPPSQETVDELYNDLKAFISEIPNVTIMEEK